MSDGDRSLRDEDRLPWLEAVESEEHRSGRGTGAVLAALVVALVALGLVVGGVFWLRDGGASRLGGSEGELIAAPAGPYKQKPTEPGGMKVEGQGDAAFAASAGAEVNAPIDIAALSEAPLAGAGSPAPAAVPDAVPAGRPAPGAATASSTSAIGPVTGGLIQLGAFSNEAKANQAWKTLAARFAYLQPLTSSVTPIKSGSGTLYRLRASAGPAAATVCGKLKVAGESCTVL